MCETKGFRIERLLYKFNLSELCNGASGSGDKTGQGEDMGPETDETSESAHGERTGKSMDEVCP